MCTEPELIPPLYELVELELELLEELDFELLDELVLLVDELLDG